MPDKDKNKSIPLDGLPDYYKIPEKPHISTENSANKNLTSSPISQEFGNTDFGDSSYDKVGKTQPEDIASGEYKFVRGESQAGLSQLGLGVLRATSKAGVEMAKTPGYLYSLGEWSLSNIKSDGNGETLDKALDNAWLNNLESLDSDIKEQLPVYQSYKAGKGGILDNIQSTSFWASDGADGVGYLLGMMAPGYALKGINLASKVSKLGLGAKTAANVELGSQTLLNTSIESLAEAKGVADRIKEKGGSEEEIANGAKETFFSNMGLLILPNALMNKNLLGRFTKDKSLLDDFRDASGKLLDNPITKKTALKDYSKAVLGSAISEGFIEEGGQTSIENYEVNKALGKTNLGFIEGVANEYLNTLSTTEGLKSIVLGSVLGSIGGVAGEYGESKQKEIIKPIISDLIKDNFEGFSVDNDIYDRDEKGRQVNVNPIKLKSALEDFTKEVVESQQKDLSALNDDKILHDYLTNKQFTRYAIPFLEQGEVGVELLNEHLDNVSDTQHLINEQNLADSKNEDFEENKYKQELKNKAKQLASIYEDTIEIVNNFNSVKSLYKNKIDPSEYINKMLNAVVQEVSKQIFYKDKIQELNNELNKVILTDIPQNKLIADNIQKQIDGLNKLLEASKAKYISLLSEEEQQNAFVDFIKDKQEEEKIIKDEIKKNEPKPVTKDEVIEANNDDEINQLLLPALESKSLNEFDSLVTKLKSNPFFKESDNKALNTKRKELLGVIDIFANSIKGGNLPNTPEEQQFYENNKSHIEARLQELKDKEERNKPTSLETILETIDLDLNSDQDLVSESNQLGENTDTESNQIITIPIDAEKGINLKNNVVMMHLFNHYFDKSGKFKFIRNEEGYPTLDNQSGLDIDTLNNIKVGDTINFKLVDIDDNINSLYKNLKDFDGKHIGIYSNNNLIGFVQQPLLVSPKSNDPELSKQIREGLIEYRKDIISKLERNIDVTEKVLNKGNGNLYTKLNENGNIDAIFDIFDSRSVDNINDNLIFIYSDKENKLKLPISELDKKDIDIINERLANINFTTKPGKIFQLVKDLNNEWSPIPVYLSKINDLTANKILEILDQITNDTDPKDIVRDLNSYVYASENRMGASVGVRNENGRIKLTANTKLFNLDDIQNVKSKRIEFINALKALRQNIDINKINTNQYQTDLQIRESLKTNITTFNQEYFIQPYIEYTQTIDTLGEAIIPNNNDLISVQPTTSNETKLDEKVNDLLSNIDLDEQLDDDNALSRTIDSTLLNRNKFNKWLKTKLPQLNLSEVESIYELKDTLIDAYGLFRDTTIYLFEGAGMKTAYHESFHGVFRNLATVKQREDIINEAINRYESPTEKQLESLQKDLKGRYSKEQLTYLYYEEKLADDFAEYTYNINDNNFLNKITSKIRELFNKIKSFFNIFKSNDTTTIDEFFNSINSGKLSTIESKSNSVVNRSLFNEYAYSKKLNSILGVSNKAKTVKAIGDRFMALFQANIFENKSVKPNIIFNKILNEYKEKFVLQDLDKNNQTRLGRIIVNFPDLVNEVKKYLEYRNVAIKENVGFNQIQEELDALNESIDIKTDLTEDKQDDLEVYTLESKTTKGLGEWTSISGLSSASTRIKLFLSSIPILRQETNDKGEITNVAIKDTYGIPMYHDFSELYYYIERNLVDKYELDEQLEVLKELSINRPELNQVIGMLTEKSSKITNEQFSLLQNDFKTNFSKQQLAYTLVKFDTDSGTGKVSYDIIDANRTTLGREIFNTWNDNLYDDSKNTIGSIDSTGNRKLDTIKAKSLLDQWQALDKTKRVIKYEVANNILLKIGIEFTPKVLNKLLKENTQLFKNNITNILKAFVANNFGDNEKISRDSLYNLINDEVNNTLEKYTSSFINGEGENIYTIQLPSFISKTLAKIKNNNKFKVYNQDLRKDPFYKNSNLLTFLEDINYRTNFKITYLDSLKDSRGKKEGVSFTSMTPKDFMSMQVALFQNNASNAQKTTSNEINKYIYITPSDKTMCVLVDASSYKVSLIENNNSLNSHKSPILSNFYNVFLQEANRIKNNLLIKEDILVNKGKGKYSLDQLLEHYHVPKNEFNKLTKLIIKNNDKGLEDEDWITIESMLVGQAFKFNQFTEGYNNSLFKLINKENQSLLDIINSSNLDNLNDNLEQFKTPIIQLLSTELSTEFIATRNEMLRKGLITYDNETRLYKPITINLGNKIQEFEGEQTIIQNAPENVNRQLNLFIAKFSSNTLLHNIELSNIFNGDFAQFKPNDLQKRTYQSQAMTVFGNFVNKVIKTIVVKDHEVGSDMYESLVNTLKSQGFNDEQIDEIAGKYKEGINVTDAQVYISPEFYKRIHIARGTWTNDMQEAYDIIEGNTSGNIKSSLQRLLGGIKPYYFGNRFDSELGMQKFEQVKCAMLPLFKGYTDMNPLLRAKREEMDNIGVDMIAHESSFKAAIGFRTSITNDNYVVLDLNTDNFGVQVDNPDHVAEGNDSMRQLKMLIIGSINPENMYNGTSGRDIIDSIMKMESENLKQSLNELKDKMDVKNNINFTEFIKEMVTKRGATINVEEALNIENGDFEYALDNGVLSTQLENMISSIYTNNAIKQHFTIGGSAVQATSLGFKYKNLTEQQDNLTEDQKLLQQELRWIKPKPEGDTIGYAEAAMPAWTEKFFNKDGKLIDIDSIPNELKELIVYRIPTEGLHSMMPIRVVKFLPETMGNFMFLPYEVTIQFGADFDFDKVYFIGREFFNDENNEFKPFSYNSEDNIKATRERYYQYSQFVKRSELMSFDEFNELPIEEQNTSVGRNNEIVNNYFKLLSSANNLNLIVSPSGFTVLEKFKFDYFNNYDKQNFFSGRTQRDLKERNHIGIALKGQAALHVSGHSYGVLMNLNSETLREDGSLDTNKSINFNGTNRTNFSGLYTDNGKLIADELASIMAAILDDIKNPLLEPLGINNNTIDILATIIRSGIDMKTALMFTSQPGVKELSKSLSANKNKIKDQNQGWFSVNDMISIYSNNAKSVLDRMDNNDDPFLQDYITIMNDSNDNLSTEELESFIKEYKVIDGKIEKGHLKENGRYRFKEANDEELLKYYSYQTRVLKQFANIESISKELVKVNKFLAINKEVGPNIEDIISKRSLLEDIERSTLLNGFNINKIPSLKETWKIHQNALSWFESYFPYSTDIYTEIKQSLVSSQSNKTLNQWSVDDRMYMNNFIRTYTDYLESSPFNNVANRKEELLTTLPLLLKSINEDINGEKKIGNISYSTIKNNVFIQQLKYKFDKDNRVYNIQLKGNRLDLQVKNNLIDGFKALFNNNDTKQLAKDIIEHSFLTTGFFRGVNTYSGLIGPDLLKELGYNDFRKQLISSFKNNLVYLPQEENDRMIDQMIRNNPRAFTKTFDTTMFHQDSSKGVPNIISTDTELVGNSGRIQDIMWDTFINDEKVAMAAQYITVYDKVKYKPELFKYIGNMRWQKISLLGKSAQLIEINPNEDITTSILKNNNPTDEVIEANEKPMVEESPYDSLTQEEKDHLNEASGWSEEDINRMNNEGDPDKLPPLDNLCE